MEHGGRCPVTGGLATRMSGDGFRKMCAGKRKLRAYMLRGVTAVAKTGEVQNHAPEWRRCEKCKGERQHWPPELEIIDIKTEDKAMAKKDKQAEAERAELERAAEAWNALMERARDAGFADIANGDPVVMAGTYIMAVNEIMAERDRLREELAARDEAPAVETLTSEETARNVALLRWARQQLEAGRIGFHIEVREAAA